MDCVCLEAGDSEVPQGSHYALHNVTGAAWSDLSAEPAALGMDQGPPEHLYGIAFVQLSVCIVERICLEMVLSFCF